MDTESSKSLWKRKPFRILRLMESKEIDLFEVFLSASLFKSGSDNQLQVFFGHCRKMGIWNTEIGRDEFLEKRGLKMSNNTFDKLISRLYNRLIDYAGIHGLLKQPAELYPYALKYFKERAISPEEIEKKMSECRRMLKNQFPNADHYRISLDLRLELATASQARAEKPSDRGLDMLHLDLDDYYITQKLRFLCASSNEQLVYGHRWEPPAKNELLQWMKSSFDTMPNLAKAYFHAYMILNSENETFHFHKFRDLLTTWGTDYVEEVEITDLYGYLLNYFTIRLNNGDLSTLTKINELFTDLLGWGTLLENGRISPDYFHNVIAIKCRLGKVDEARAFMADFASRLTRTQDNTAIGYNEIFIAFYEGRYNEVRKKAEAMMELSDTNKADQYYGLNLRCLLLKTYFSSLGELDLAAWDEAEEKFQGLLRSFRGYIERKDISRMSKVRFENFRKAVHRLYHVHYALPETEDFSAVKKELLQDFNSSSNLPDKGWFIAQV